MHTDGLRILSEFLQRPLVQVDVRQKALRAAADDGERQRKAIARGAHHRLRAAADADPGAQAPVFYRRIDDGLLIEKLDEGSQLLFEQLVVFRKIVAEQ